MSATCDLHDSPGYGLLEIACDRRAVHRVTEDDGGEIWVCDRHLSRVRTPGCRVERLLSEPPRG